MFGAGLILFEGRVPDSRQSTFAPFFEDTARPEGSGPVQTVSCRSIFLDRFACILAPFETRCNLTPSLAVSTDRVWSMELLERFAAGDLEAFEALFRQHQKEVYAWTVRIVRDSCAAEDLTVETFWRVYRARGRFRPRRGEFSRLGPPHCHQRGPGSSPPRAEGNRASRGFPRRSPGRSCRPRRTAWPPPASVSRAPLEIPPRRHSRAHRRRALPGNRRRCRHFARAC